MKIAIIGYGNIGRAAQQAALNAPDMELTGIFHHDDDLSLVDADVALLTTPTREVPQFATQLLTRGISTVDSFDIHTDIFSLREQLTPLALNHKAVSIISSGWDPGSDSVVRALLTALIPEGEMYTNFGPGRSMGHTVVAKSIEGVKDALSMTLPAGKGKHRRHVYVELKDGYTLADVRERLLRDDYFAHDETEVEQVVSVAALNTTDHGVHIERNGKSGVTNNQQIDFTMRINNPALTGQMMVSAARAAYRMRQNQRYGAYTLIEVAPIDFLPGDKETLIRSLV